MHCGKSKTFCGRRRIKPINKQTNIMKWKKTSLFATRAALCSMALFCGCNRDQSPLNRKNAAAAKWSDRSLHLSPFTKVRFEGEMPLVEYAGAEYQLSAINGLPASELVEFCKREYKDQWQKRIAEDLVVALDDSGHPANSAHRVSLSLKDSKTGETTEIKDALMTEKNRQMVLESLSTHRP
jgi:hypothetical protein